MHIYVASSWRNTYYPEVIQALRDADKKIVLGNLWANKAGADYRYCLVYNNRCEEGAYTKDVFIEFLKIL